MSTSRGNKAGREKASKTNHIQNGKTEPTQIGSKNQASNMLSIFFEFCHMMSHSCSDNCN